MGIADNGPVITTGQHTQHTAHSSVSLCASSGTIYSRSVSLLFSFDPRIKVKSYHNEALERVQKATIFADL
jgi:hypothetical protein